MKVKSFGMRGAAVTAALVLAVGGTVVSAHAANPTFVDCYQYAAGEPDHIDPALTSTLAGASVATMLYDGLTDTAADGSLQPEVAAKWKTPDSGKTWIFTLKSGLKFSNGEAVLPSSFVTGWKRSMDSKLASEVAYHGDFILGMNAYSSGKGPWPAASVVADDKAMTLTVKMQDPTPDWPSIVGHSVFSPMPKAMATADAKIEENGTKMIGNGPYMLAEAITKRAGGAITLVPNPKYAGSVSLSKITFKISSDVNAAYNAFASGQCDNGPIPAGRYTELLTKWGKGGLKSTLGTDYWGFNWEDPIVGGTKNVLLRSAIAKAIDKQQISDVIYQGVRKPASGLLPPGLPGYKATGQGLTTTRDLDGAKKDLAKFVAAGGKVPTTPIRLSYNDGAGWDKVASIMIQNLADIGVPAKLDPFAADGTYFSKMRKGQGQIIRAGWFADYPIADNFLYPLLHSKSIDGDNLERYNSPAFDNLVNAARACFGKVCANAKYQQAEALALKKDVVIVPTVNRGIAAVLQPSVTSFPITPLGMIAYDKIAKN